MLSFILVLFPPTNPEERVAEAISLSVIEFAFGEIFELDNSK